MTRDMDKKRAGNEIPSLEASSKLVVSGEMKEQNVTSKCQQNCQPTTKI